MGKVDGDFEEKSVVLRRLLDNMSDRAVGEERNPDQRRDTNGALTLQVDSLNEEMNKLIEARDELETRCESLQSEKDHL